MSTRLQMSGFAWAVWLGVLAGMLSVFFPKVLLAQPITFPTSMSLGDKDFFVRVQPWYIRSANDPSGRNRKLTEWNIRLMGMYGLTAQTALFVTAPYIDRTREEGGRSSYDRGIGDVTLFLRHTVIERNWPQGTFSVSPFIGAEVPLNKKIQTAFSDGYTLDSKSVGYLIGFAIRDATLGRPHRFFSMRYSFRPEHKDFENGDAFEINVAIKPGLLSWETKRGGLAGVNGMLESQVSLARLPAT